MAEQESTSTVAPQEPKDESSPLKSRKLWTSVLSTALYVVMPIIFQKLGISNEVQLLSIGCVAATNGIYSVANVLDKK